jgi:hypothetical protein
MQGGPVRGARLHGRDGTRIGTVDAVFADYVLVRTRGLLPVDLYIPRSELVLANGGQPRVEATPEEAYERWHRPLRRAPHS